MEAKTLLHELQEELNNIGFTVSGVFESGTQYTLLFGEHSIINSVTHNVKILTEGYHIRRLSYSITETTNGMIITGKNIYNDSAIWGNINTKEKTNLLIDKILEQETIKQHIRSKKIKKLIGNTK